MKILVLGGNGAVGQLAIHELLTAKHEVTALVRNPSAMRMEHPRLTVVQGDPTNLSHLDLFLTGQDVVLSTLGARTNKRTTLRTNVATNILIGMKRHGVRKLVWLDAAGVGSSKEFVQRSSFFLGRIIMPIFLNHIYEDAGRADALIEKSGCDSVIVRPVSLTNGERTGTISVITDMSRPAKLRLRIARADVAAFLVQQIVDDQYVGRSPIIFT